MRSSRRWIGRLISFQSTPRRFVLVSALGSIGSCARAGRSRHCEAVSAEVQMIGSDDESSCEEGRVRA